MHHRFITIERGFKMGKSIIQNNIRRLRFDNDEMTQQELADKVNVSRQTIVAIEKGNYSPSLELAFRISHIFNKKLEELFSYDVPDSVSVK
jgi:putative transcriptional regulator